MGTKWSSGSLARLSQGLLSPSRCLSPKPGWLRPVKDDTSFSHIPHTPVHQQILLILLLKKVVLHLTTFYLLHGSHPGSIHYSLWPDFLKQPPHWFLFLPFPPLVYCQHSNQKDPIEMCQLRSLFCSKPSDGFSSHPE